MHGGEEPPPHTDSPHTSPVHAHPSVGWQHSWHHLVMIWGFHLLHDLRCAKFLGVGFGGARLCSSLCVAHHMGLVVVVALVGCGDDEAAPLVTLHHLCACSVCACALRRGVISVLFGITALRQLAQRYDLLP